jgi:hypothetical protein
MKNKKNRNLYISIMSLLIVLIIFLIYYYSNNQLSNNPQIQKNSKPYKQIDTKLKNELEKINKLDTTNSILKNNLKSLDETNEQKTYKKILQRSKNQEIKAPNDIRKLEYEVELMSIELDDKKRFLDEQTKEELEEFGNIDENMQLADKLIQEVNKKENLNQKDIIAKIKKELNTKIKDPKFIKKDIQIKKELKNSEDIASKLQKLQSQ